MISHIPISLLLFINLIIITLVLPIECQYEDVRCKCVCPSTGVVTQNETDGTDRKLYIGRVPPNQCNCDNVVLTHFGPEIRQKAKEFCPLCECKYESRNITTIRWVVICIIGIIAFLIVYMAFLMLLDPLYHKSGQRSSYEEHVNEEVVMDEQIVSDSDGTRRRVTAQLNSPTVSGDGTPPKNVMNRVGFQQTKWKKQVMEQRKNIYDKHTMLD